MVNHIFRRLHRHLGDQPKRLREYLMMIEVLAENRDLKPQFLEAERMLTQIDVTRLPSYQLGMEQGLKEGLEQGRQQARERALAQGQARMLARQLRVRFGSLPPELQARLEAAPIERLDVWGERLLTAESLEAVFDEAP